MRISTIIRRGAQINNNGIATDYQGRAHNWGELKTRVSRLAGGLQGLGVGLGDRVAMLSLNSDRYLEYFFGVTWAGGAFVPINTRLAPPEILHWLNDSGSSVLCIDDNFAPLLPQLQGKMESVKTIVYTGEGHTPEGMVSFESLIENGTEIEALDTGGDEMAGLFYTGGTTGRSKGVMLSHRNLLVNALSASGELGFSPRSNYLHAAPMFHIADGLTTFAITSLAGISTIVPGFEPVTVMQAIQEKKINIVLLVPTMVNMLVNHPDIASYDLSSLKDIVFGASPMPGAVLKTALRVIPDAQFHHAYGQTEASPAITILPANRMVEEGPLAGKIKSAGLAIPGVEVKIADEDGNEVPRGEVGEICNRGENIMLGYWGQPELTAQTVRDGWLHTGDGGRMDEEGFVFIVDRIKDMIISGGENIYSVEVENAVFQHPAVAECAVIGIPSDKWGEQVHAIVRLKDGETVDDVDIMTHCRELIAGFKCPRSVEFVTDPLPLSGAGKVLKTELRKQYWQDQETQVH